MEFRCLQIAVIISVFKACLSSKNNTTIYVCIGEDVTLSCPPAGFNKTISWFRRNVSKNTITTLYRGTRGKDTHLPLNTAVDVNEEKFNLTIKNLTEADNGTYQCLHDKNFTSWLFRLIIKCSGDCPIANKSNEPITTVIPQCSGGFLTSDKIIYGVVVVLLVLVLIIVSLICHAYIRNQYKRRNAPDPQTEVVRPSPVQIEMQEVSNNEEHAHEESRDLQLLSENLEKDLLNASSDDKQGDLSQTSISQSSSSLSNKSENEEDYLHPYHGFVQSKIDVHEYATVTVDAQESTEYEEITGTSKKQIVIYENLKS
ncbi:unnamed protein product [Mytilus edulis]|uniref:Ig-like domain-containing protein n=1 Tax=Mytilus edulis TaxID=6550 RepID=A0A8S3V5L5_MYTED|nr:unnamed protein product [Mytilus edulis]